MIKFIRKLMTREPKRLYVIVLQMRRQKLYFSTIRNNRPNFCTLRAGACYFSSPGEARDFRAKINQIDASYGQLNIESFVKV